MRSTTATHRQNGMGEVSCAKCGRGGWARSVVQNVGAAAGSGVELAAQKRSETRIEQEDDVEELLKSDELVVDVKGNVNWEKAGLE